MPTKRPTLAEGGVSRGQHGGSLGRNQGFRDRILKTFNTDIIIPLLLLQLLWNGNTEIEW
jgi:hypothetical protein